jgi:hypothetical protein
MNKHEEFEEWVAKQTNGRNLNTENKRSVYDVLSGNGAKLECKLSGDPSCNNQAKCRNLLGDGRTPKMYDRLIWGIESTLHADVILFDIPYLWVTRFCANRRGRTLNCGLDRVQSWPGSELWAKYRITEDQLTERYGKHAPRYRPSTPEDEEEPVPRRCPFCHDERGEIRRVRGGYQGVCPTCGATGPKRESHDEGLRAWNGKER